MLQEASSVVGITHYRLNLSSEVSAIAVPKEEYTLALFRQFTMPAYI